MNLPVKAEQFPITTTCYWAFVLAMLQLTAGTQAQEPNYDELKVPKFTLPDPLVMNDGTTVADSIMWNSRRRAEILQAFEGHVYGSMPALQKLDSAWSKRPNWKLPWNQRHQIQLVFKHE